MNAEQQLEDLLGDIDFDDREEARAKIIEAFNSKIQIGKDLNARDLKRLEASLKQWGLTKEQFGECMSITVGAIWEKFLAFMASSMSQEVKAHKDHMKRLQDGKKREKKLKIETFISRILGIKEYQMESIGLWLTEADQAYFLERVAERFVEKGYFVTTRMGNLYYYMSTNEHPIDAVVTWNEGDEIKSLRPARVYKLDLESGTIFFLRGIPSQPGRSGLYNTELFHTIVCDQSVDIAKVFAEIEALYYENCLFKNKVTRVTLDIKGNPIFTIKKLNKKPAIIDEKSQQKFNHIKNVIANWDNLPKGHRKYGLVMYGKPGGGKTSSITQLLDSIDGQATVFYVSTVSATFLAKVYPWLERLGSNVCIYEDMDAIQVRRDDNIHGPADTKFISVLLDVLDGDTEYDVITIATTNFPEQFDAAVLRPGRLGVCIEYAAPDRAMKIKIIDYYLTKNKLELGMIEHDSQSLADTIFSNDQIMGSHICYVLRDTAIKHTLGAGLLDALNEAASEYLGDSSIGWQRLLEQDTNRKKVGFGSKN